MMVKMGMTGTQVSKYAHAPNEPTRRPQLILLLLYFSSSSNTYWIDPPIPATPNVAQSSPSGMFSRNPERTERTQRMMLMAQRVSDRSASDGTMRIGMPMAMMSPCFQSMLRTSVSPEDAPDAA